MSGHPCGSCEATWTGLAAAHCPSCHDTFSTVALFDRHRRGSACLDPSTVLDAAGTRVMYRGADDMWRPVAAELTLNRGRR